MKVMVLGATGATGRLAVKELLDRGFDVTAVVRSEARMMEALETDSIPDRLKLIEGTVLDMEQKVLSELLINCDSVLSFLGHNLNWRGIYGNPRRLVTHSVRRVCEAVQTAHPSNQEPLRMVLMNTTGNSNPDLREKRSFGERLAVGLIRVLLPPQRDNEEAAEYLRKVVGRDNPIINWTVVRPDGLINEDRPTGFQVVPSPTRSPIFNAGKTSRANVARFMTELAAGDVVWDDWKGRMPVIYNEGYAS